MINSFIKTLSILTIFLLLGLSSYAQCAMCKANVKNAASSKIKKTGTGINDGIVSLVFIPYLAVGVIGLIYYKNYKQKLRDAK